MQMNDADAMSDQNATAVSLFGRAGSTSDFPVLKAFQEYIDAEQAKARKRMLGLSVFFILLLLVVVITFTIVVMSVINRNQALSDRLLDIVIREKQQTVQPVQPVVNVQPPAPQPIVQPVQPASHESTLKPVLEKIEALVGALTAARQQQPVAPAPVVVTTAAPAPFQPQPAAESVETLRMREELKKQKEALEAERARLKETQEKLKQSEIETHRRRLYPEYYAAEDARFKKGNTPLPDIPPIAVREKAHLQVEPNRKAQNLKSTPPSASLDKLEPINYFEQDDDDLKDLVKARKTPPSASTKPASAVKSVRNAKTPPPAPSKPSALSSTVKTESLNVGSRSDDTIPWLIEQQNP